MIGQGFVLIIHCKSPWGISLHNRHNALTLGIYLKQQPHWWSFKGCLCYVLAFRYFRGCWREFPTFAWWAAALSSAMGWAGAGIWVFRLEQPGMGASQPWYLPPTAPTQLYTWSSDFKCYPALSLAPGRRGLTHVKFKTADGFSEFCQAWNNVLVNMNADKIS